MKYIFSSKQIVTSLLFVGTLFSAQATRESNYAEMGFALATIPFGMAAHHHALNDNKKSAAALHITADTLSLLNKAFFFFNNMQVVRAQGAWQLQRDSLVNGVLTLREITKLFQHFKAYRDALGDFTGDEFDEFDDLANIPVVINEPECDPDLETDELVSFESDLEQDEQDESTDRFSALAYGWQVLALPSLKGLSAFALACAQDQSSPFARQQARFVATAALSFSNLLEEYTLIDAESPYKKVIAALLFINAVWLAYEIKNYQSTYKNKTPIPLPRISPPHFNVVQNEEAACEICFDDIEGTVRTPCGHTYCKGCLTIHINTKIKNHEVGSMNCPGGCNHNINDVDIADITNGDAVIRLAYVDAMLKKDLHVGAVEGLRQCPTPNCPYAFENEGDHRMIQDCPSCHQIYCGNCLGKYANNGQLHNDCKNSMDIAKEDGEWLKQNTRTCPGCKKLLYKYEGCNHMTCKCAHEFCWVCNKSYDKQRYGWTKACGCH